VSRDSLLLPYRYHKYVIVIAKTFGGCASRAQRTAHGKDFELILTVKIETRHPAGRRGHLTGNFLAFVIIAEL